MTELSRYGRLEDELVAHGFDSGLDAAGLRTIARTASPMSFNISEYPALLIFWRGTNTVQTKTNPGHVRTRAECSFGMLILMRSSDPLQGEARMGDDGAYRIADLTRAAYTGWVPDPSIGFLCQFPMVPGSEKPVVVDDGRYGLLMDFGIMLEFEEGVP